MGAFDFSNLTSEGRENIHREIEYFQRSLANKPNIRIFKERHIDEWRNFLGHHRLTAISIDENLVDDMNFENLSSATKEIPQQWNTYLRNYNLIIMDKNCNPIGGENHNWDDNKIEELSKKGNVLFYIGDGGVDIYVSGTCQLKSNPFTTEEARRRFKELYEIEDLDKCISDYQKALDDPGFVGAFFLPKAIYGRIKDAEGLTRLLKSKPEDLLRNNLKNFLNVNTQYLWNKEIVLNSNNRLDLYTEANGFPVTIEVKWLGKCVNKEATAVSSKSYTTGRIKEGVIQTLYYIKELHEQDKFFTLKNHLFVFDAREDHLRKPFDLDDKSFIPENLHKFFDFHYKTLPLVQLNNN